MGGGEPPRKREMNPQYGILPDFRENPTAAQFPGRDKMNKKKEKISKTGVNFLGKRPIYSVKALDKSRREW
ncbi:MAG: hypothetical protein IJU66_04510 [Oscillospiraceae bacterium]|nr:hypothetical protein [Oscillospiraceae bacterium]